MEEQTQTKHSPPSTHTRKYKTLGIYPALTIGQCPTHLGWTRTNRWQVGGANFWRKQNASDACTLAMRLRPRFNMSSFFLSGAHQQSSGRFLSPIHKRRTLQKCGGARPYSPRHDIIQPMLHSNMAQMHITYWTNTHNTEEKSLALQYDWNAS